MASTPASFQYPQQLVHVHVEGFVSSLENEYLKFEIIY